MLKTSLQEIISKEPVRSHHGELIKILTNAEKQAKVNTRISFLITCRKDHLTPKFISDQVGDFGNNTDTV